MKRLLLPSIHTMYTLAPLAFTAAVLAACGSSEPTEVVPGEDPDAGVNLPSEDLGSGPDAAEPSGVELSPALCDDPSNLQAVLGGLGAGGGNAGSGSLDMNEDELQKLLAKPTERFYMVNLIKFREQAEYADGRETNLTGEEANALYDPLPLIQAMGGRIVYSATVDQQIDGGDDVAWENIAIVEYPCPIGFLAMVTSPEFQETQVHKEAGVEITRVMFSELQPLPSPADPDQSEAAFPPTAEDPAFDLMHVMDFHDIAQYEPGANEPERTGEEAWNLYQSGGTGASMALGHYPTAFFTVTGTLIGENTGWDQIQIVHMSSQAGFQALLDEEMRQEGRYHRLAALSDNDSMIMFPRLSSIPYTDDDGGGAMGPEVTPNGTGTPCRDDAECPDASFICLSDGVSTGFCTPQGCGAGTCEGSYLCCRECSSVVADQLPFQGSACFPGASATALTNAPASCTCD
ncbi:MAG: hypothetical protein AAFU79_20995 [Myxococcota bacterium]